FLQILLYIHFLTFLLFLPFSSSSPCFFQYSPSSLSSSHTTSSFNSTKRQMKLPTCRACCQVKKKHRCPARNPNTTVKREQKMQKLPAKALKARRRKRKRRRKKLKKKKRSEEKKRMEEEQNKKKNMEEEKMKEKEVEEEEEEGT